MTAQTPPDRCRLVLIAPPLMREEDARAVLAALTGGDVASLILPLHTLDEATFQKRAEAIVGPAQERGVAVVIAGEARLAHRLKADGIHFEGRKEDLAATIARNSGMIMGCGGAKTRDDALELGEEQPDYVFFGRFGYDTKPEPHSRNLTLGRWWAEMVNIPGVVLGGYDIASLDEVAATGVEFAALSSAIFAEGIDPVEAVASANRRLDAGAAGVEAP